MSLIRSKSFCVQNYKNSMTLKTIRQKNLAVTLLFRIFAPSMFDVKWLMVHGHSLCYR